MPDRPRRRTIAIVLLLLLLLAIVLLLLFRCTPRKQPSQPPQPAPAAAPVAQPAATPAAPTTAPEQRAEVLTPATLTFPAQVAAGAAFSVAWTGPANPEDYITIVKPDAAPETFGHYQQTTAGPTLSLTAPIDTGNYEVRYIAGRSRTILGRGPVEVLPIAAALDAAAEVTLGSAFPVRWTGPNNQGDYITIVAAGAPDEHFASYTNTSAGSPLTLTAPTTTGDAELRYVVAQGRKVLARRPIKVIAAVVSLAAPEQAVAGSTIDVTWTGPNNTGDYITIVPAGTPDGQYRNYSNVSAGSPLKLLTPIMEGPAELRYMTGQGHKVLARRPIAIAAARITLSAPAESAPGATVAITWTGPNNPGDYITIVTKSTPDGQYAQYANTSAGSPLKVKAPPQPGDAEIRYMTGQGNKVLARIAIRIAP